MASFNRPKFELPTARGRGLRLAATALLAASTGLQAKAQDPAPVLDPDAAKLKLELQSDELKSTEGRTTALQADMADLDTERERLNARLVETAALIQRSEAQMTAIEGRLNELELQEKIVRGSLEQRHGQIATLLGALQRMGRNPPPVLITRREDALTMVRSAMLLSSAFPELKDKAVELASSLDELSRVKNDIRSEGERLQAETDQMEASHKRLSSLMEAKKLTIADRQQELIAVRTASAEITKNVTDLTQLIDKLDQSVTANVKTLGAYQAKVQTQAAATSPAPASQRIIVRPDSAVAGATEPTSPNPVTPDTGPPVAPTVAAVPAAAVPADGQAAAAPASAEAKVAALAPPRLKPQIVELAPAAAGGSLITGSAGRIEPAVPFSATRAKLPSPAFGRRALSFGERTQYGGQSKGLVIETRSGAQVVSPCDGWIVYAGEFRAYGQLLIINAGDGYHILLAGMSQIDVQPGQFVLAAEPVGSMVGRGKDQAATGQIGAPVLYVEFRKDGRPIDPDPWWATGQQKVQG